MPLFNNLPASTAGTNLINTQHAPTLPNSTGQLDTTQNHPLSAPSTSAVAIAQEADIQARMQVLDQKMDMLMTMFWTVMRQMSTANGRTMNIPGDPFQAPAPRTYVAPPQAHVQRILALPIMQAALPLALTLDPDDQDVLMTGPTDTIHGMASLAPFPVPQEARNGDSPVIAPARLHPPSSGTSIEASPTTIGDGGHGPSGKPSCGLSTAR